MFSTYQIIGISLFCFPHDLIYCFSLFVLFHQQSFFLKLILSWRFVICLKKKTMSQQNWIVNEEFSRIKITSPTKYLIYLFRKTKIPDLCNKRTSWCPLFLTKFFGYIKLEGILRSVYERLLAYAVIDLFSIPRFALLCLKSDRTILHFNIHLKMSSRPFFKIHLTEKVFSLIFNVTFWFLLLFFQFFLNFF